MSQSDPPRVLVIDDDDLVRNVIYDIVTSFGYGADMAASGAAGLALFDQNRYDVVLTDLLMPGMTGLEVLAAVRARDPKIPVLLISGSAAWAGDQRPLQDGVVLIKKPVDIRVLENALSRVLTNGH